MKKIVYENKQQNTHGSMRSKSSTSSSGAEAFLITIVCTEVLEERSSVTCFLFLSMPLSMDFVSQEHGVPRDGPKDSNAGG
jgi:hypothetical protein